MAPYPYLFFGSAPIGPIALEVLRLHRYEPTAVIDDPKLTLVEQIALVEEHKPTFFLVVGYGAILKRDLLDTVAGQALNIHPSLLPLYRGPAPVVQTILDGASETGVSLMEVDTQMDHGPILAQHTHRLRGDEYPDELYRILTHRGVELFLDKIDAYLEEEAEMLPQNHAEATFTRFVKKEDGLLDLKDPADINERKVRAYQGWPRAWVLYERKRLLIDAAHVAHGKLRFDTVQPEGKKVMSFAAFCNGIRKSPDEVYRAVGL